MLIWILSLLACPGYDWAQEPIASPSTGIVLRVEGLVEHALSLSVEELARMPRQTVDATDHDGKPVRFEGVALSEVLKAAGTPLGDRLRGPQLSKFLLVEAADVFFSADKAQMDGLEAAGLVRGQDRVDVLSNVLVAVVPAASTTRLSGPSDLQTVRRLALADPQAVPAGVYARTWLESIGLWDKLKDRVVPTLNVSAALSAVESENADAGIVYRTDAGISKRVKVAFEVPRDWEG